MAEAVGAHHIDGPAGVGRDYRLVRGVGLLGQALGAIGLHQHEVRQRRQQLKGQCRSAQLALRRFPGYAYHAVSRQGGGHGSGVRCQQRGVLLRPLDVGGGGDEHCPPAAQLFRQGIHQRGLAAAADEGGDALFHLQQGGNVHYKSSGTRTHPMGAPFSKVT